MTTQPTTTTLTDAVQDALAHRAGSEPGFLERLVLDPKGTIAPMIAQLLGDDGELDLGGTDIQVHLQTPRTAHFVVTLGEPETVGFASLGANWLDVRLVPVRPGRFKGVGSDNNTEGTETTCNSSVSCCQTHCTGEGLVGGW